MSRDTALVTGASAGIGRAFAHGLAVRGYDLVLVARDGARLTALADELTRAHGVAVEALPADLVTAEGVAAVDACLRAADRPVDLLVNNAGFGTFGRFAELDVDREVEEIELNVVALVRLTSVALAAMETRAAAAPSSTSRRSPRTNRRPPARPTARPRRSCTASPTRSTRRPGAPACT